MHIPSAFQEINPRVLHKLITDYPLGTLIYAREGSANAEHIPFYLKRSDNQQVSLQGHVAKTNPLWQQCTDEQEVLLIFHGPNAYISPNFYPSKKATGKAVPTWNYSVVHIKGRIYFKQERQWLLQLLDAMSNTHEKNQSHPWSMSDSPESWLKTLVDAVVGFEVVIDSIVGKFKFSQNKQPDDYMGVIQSLSNSEHHSDIAVAKAMIDPTE